jgi:hypothetical protein
LRFTAKTSLAPIKATAAAAARYQQDLRAAAIIATDRASKDAQRGVQERIRGTGLGRLANAVGQTSMRREVAALRGPTAQVRAYRLIGNPYGVIFARGGDDSLAGGALESYARGATIRPGPGKVWLAIPTRAVPKFIRIGGVRRRLTPELYMRSPLMQSIGRLEFRPLAGGDKAIWVIKKVSVSPKTGQAKRMGPRKTRTRIPQKEVIAFNGIRVTRRAQRFDKDGVVGFYARRVPLYMTEALAEVQRGRA